MRCFIAVEPDAELKEKIFNYAKKLRGFLKLVEKENLHITLKFLGEIENVKEVAKALEALQGFGSFEVKLRGAGAFPSKNRARVVWIGVESPRLIELQKTVDSLLEALGFVKEVNYVPHLTIARIKGQSNARGFIEEFENFEFGSFEVRELKLKQSILTPRGPVYRDLKVVVL